MKALFRGLSMVCALAAMSAGANSGAAQGWGWGESRGYEPPSSYDQPSRPVYGQPGGQPYGQPYGQPAYGGPPPSQAYGSANPRCRDLEAQLTGGLQGAGQDQLPRIENDMRQADGQYHRAQSDADRSDCYEDMFLFGRSLRRTPRCIDLDRQVQAAKSTLAQLKAQRDAILRGTTPRARHDDIVAELARNRCGDQYVREHEAQRGRSNSLFTFFSDEDASDEERSRLAPPAAAYSGNSSTYRTLCVRECDGFYFPISTATSEAQFKDDEAKCHSQCAAPAELYYHRSDQDVDQMVSLTGKPYAQMPFAFRNRKVYLKGCSCNTAEYSREEIAKSEEALKASRRADASAGKSATDAAFAKRISQAVQNAPQTPPAPEPAPQPSPNR
ncbi:MAG: DUF2865 domain-containing protein [Rhodomicrobium sp.]|jgi:hypothetical protein